MEVSEVGFRSLFSEHLLLLVKEESLFSEVTKQLCEPPNNKDFN